MTAAFASDFKTAKALGDALRAKQVSAVELAQAHLDRIARHADLGAFLATDPAVSLAQARAADVRRARGEATALTGVPLAHKDIFVTREFPTTAASRMLAGYRSPFDATVVQKLAAEGMVCLGKLNCDEFAMGSGNENSAYGAVRNPWDTTRVPGGSSGGSAAAVAAGLVPAATGTDTGGSIRQPSAFCGLTGIKPTYGRVSRYGMVAYASSLDQAGPLAHTAEDCALLLSAMAGPDPLRDATSLDEPAEDYTRRLDEPLAGLRIGLADAFFGDGLADDVRASLEQALRELERLGARRVSISLPSIRLAIPAYYVIASAEASSNLSRYDGVKFGHRAARYADLEDMYERSRAEGFGAEVKRRIMTGTYVLSHGYYDAYYLQAQKVRRMIVDDFQRAFQHCDVIAGPVAPTVAWHLGACRAWGVESENRPQREQFSPGLQPNSQAIGQKDGEKWTAAVDLQPTICKSDRLPNAQERGPLDDYLADVYTLPASLAGLPAMSVPAGFGAHGMPVGLQLMANYFQEARLLNAAHRLQQATDFHARRPEGY